VTEKPEEAQKSTPSVSWLLCTNKEDTLLHRAISSCLAQTMDDFELLLVVNGSQTEHILPILAQKYANEQRIRVIGTSVSLLNFSLSLGIHLARAPLIARMDADDISKPDRLARQLAFMNAHPNVAVLGSSYNLIDQDGKVIKHIAVPTSDKEIRRALLFTNPICHPSVILRRDAILSIGAYLGGKNAEDYDLWLRLTNTNTWKFANLLEPLLDYNESPLGQARNSKVAYANVSAAQWRQFLLTHKPRWLFSSVFTAFKSFVLSKKA